MPGKRRPSLLSKTLGNAMRANLSQTDKDCIKAVFEKHTADKLLPQLRGEDDAGGITMFGKKKLKDEIKTLTKNNAELGKVILDMTAEAHKQAEELAGAKDELLRARQACDEMRRVNKGLKEKNRIYEERMQKIRALTED